MSGDRIPASIAVSTVPGRVVHLLERFTDEVFDLLGPTTAALSQSSVDQVVVVVDSPSRRALLARLDDSIELVLVPPQDDLITQWRSLGIAFAHTLGERPVKAIHLHGFAASLIGEVALRKVPQAVPIFYSPHDSRTLHPLRWVGTLARLVAGMFLPRRDALAIGHGAPEVRALHGLSHQTVRLVEGPVSAPFFEVTGAPARHPLIIAASRTHNLRGVEAFDQLAVLLGGGVLHLSFNWIGPVNEVSSARLKAANVGVFEAGDDAERASRLAGGWLYVALGGNRGFPLCLAEAMAAGLPCVAIDTPFHRDMVRHGETGYLCRSQTEIIDRIAQLIDTPRLRQRMGRAARTLARERFSEASFREALLSAYQLGDELPVPVSVPGGEAAGAATQAAPLALPTTVREFP
jgi:glycosyltransferase involved in cell wall biosynthesis